MTRWMVRTSKNELVGPFEQEQLLADIRSGRWELRDEVCRENHYWFAFHESAELFAQLGISWPERMASSDSDDEETDEITETQTATALTSSSLATHSYGADLEPRPWWNHPLLWLGLLGMVVVALVLLLLGPL